MTKKIFFHVSDYDNAPELSIDDEGVVRINGEEVTDSDVIAKALTDNAKAWGKCVAESGLGLTNSSVYAGVRIKGPWPR